MYKRRRPALRPPLLAAAAACRSVSPTLFPAVNADDVHTVQRLVRRGADVNAPDRASFETPLYRALERNHASMTRFLLQRGADPNLPCDEFSTKFPLFHCIEHENPNLLRTVLHHGADVNVVDDWGYTPLDRAVAACVHARNPTRAWAVLDLILESNVDFDVQRQAQGVMACFKMEDGTARWPRRIEAVVARHGHRQLLAYLRALPGPRLDDRDRFGKTALHRAAENGQWEAAQYLLNRGASALVRDHAGRRPHESALHRRAHVRRALSWGGARGTEYYPRPVAEVLRNKPYAEIGRILRRAAHAQQAYEMLWRARRDGAGAGVVGAAVGTAVNILLRVPDDLFRRICEMGTARHTLPDDNEEV